jgi:hypothetical protein
MGSRGNGKKIAEKIKTYLPKSHFANSALSLTRSGAPPTIVSSDMAQYLLIRSGAWRLPDGEINAANR